MVRTWLITALAVLASLTVKGAEPEPTLMRILVGEQLEQPLVEVTGRYRVMNPQTHRYVSRGLLGKCYPVQSLETGIRWGEEFLGLYQIAICPADGRSSVLVNGVQYRGVIVLYQVGDRISVVNEVPIDYYCKVILGPQFAQHSLPTEVMSALAILTRTHACWEAKRHANSLFDVRAEDVGYRGHAVTLASPDVIAAVDGTRYMVLEQGACPGQSFPAVWTEDCAGKTAPYQVIFRTAGVETHGVEVPTAAHHRPNTLWKIAIPKQWLSKAAGLQDLSRISLYTDGGSNKVYAVRLSDGDCSVDMDYANLQKVIGKDRLLSNDFTASIEGNEVVFSGYGKGHGVGLCLFSAEQMAAKGKNAAEILSTFFPDTSLRIFEPEGKKKLPIMARFFPGKGERASQSW